VANFVNVSRYSLIRLVFGAVLVTSSLSCFASLSASDLSAALMAGLALIAARRLSISS